MVDIYRLESITQCDFHGTGFFLAITLYVRKIIQNVHSIITFAFNVLSETVNGYGNGSNLNV